MSPTIDVTFDFRTDAGGKDPDIASPTLRLYHRVLWGRALPSGAPFELSDRKPGAYLHHGSSLGEFALSSDSVIATFTRWVSMKPIIDQIPEEDSEAFRSVSYTIGGMLVFPSNTVGRKPTINGARGFNRTIADRLDLTLECIRRHYRREPSPLADTLDRYADFFALFDDFRGYVEHFLLDDLLTERGDVSFFQPFDDFQGPAVPKSLADYLDYRRRSIEFVHARNQRILTVGY